MWRNHFTLRALDDSAQLLTKQLQDIQFKMQQVLAGATEQRARWKRCVGSTDAALGEVLGQVYVRDKFAGGREASTASSGARRGPTGRRGCGRG